MENMLNGITFSNPKGDLLQAVVAFIKKLVALVKEIIAKLGIELPTLKIGE